MAVENFKCHECQCENVCLVMKKLVVFSEDANKQLGVDITMDGCENFKQVRIPEQK